MKSFFSLCILALLASAAEHDVRQEAAPPVITAMRVYHSVIDQSPFLVEATTTVVWTQSPSITDSQPAPTQLPTDLPSGVSISIPTDINATDSTSATSAAAPVSSGVSTTSSDARATVV